MPLPFVYTTDPEMIPRDVRKITLVRDLGRPIVRYACPDECWSAHFPAWQRASRKATKDKLPPPPEPMPERHCMFENPTQHGAIPYGCEDPAVLRSAIEFMVRGDLESWDRDTPKDKLEQIIQSTVEAKLKGVDLGIWPFLACLSATP